MNIPPNDTLALAVVDAIRAGDLDTLKRLLTENPALATLRIGGADNTSGSMLHTLLHVATDWPGHLPFVSSSRLCAFA